MFESCTPDVTGSGARAGSLQRDARDLVVMIDALTRHRRVDSPSGFSVHDSGGEANSEAGREASCENRGQSGRIVTVDILLPAEDDDLHETLLRYAADVRCLDRDGQPLLQVRFFRDGRRDRDDAVVGPFDRWPPGNCTVAIDLTDDAACSPRRFEDLLDLAARAEHQGRTVYFLNVPSYLRLHAEVCAGSIPKPINREMVGPRLPDVLSGPRR